MVGVQTEELGAKFDEPNVAAFFPLHVGETFLV